MRILPILFVAAMLAGCAGGPAQTDLSQSLQDTDGDGVIDAIEVLYGSDPRNATSVPDLMVHKDISFATTVANVVGTGVPSVQCPADPVNTKTVVWTITPPMGNVSQVHAANLVFTITGMTTVNDADLFIYGPDGNLAGSATGSTASETVTLAGHRPVGDYTIEVRACSGAGNVDVDATGMLGWIPSQDDLLAGNMSDDGHQH